MKGKKAMVWQIWLLNCAISKNGSNKVTTELRVEQFRSEIILVNSNRTEWSAIWSEIIRMISKSNEHAVQVRFEKYDFRPKLHNPKFNCHFIRSILKSHNLIEVKFAKQWLFLSFIFLQCNW